MSRLSLAHRLGAREADVEAYELGLARVQAAQLAQIADALDVGIDFFYGETPLLARPEFARAADAIEPGPGPRSCGATSPAMASRYEGRPDHMPDFIHATAFVQALAVMRAYCQSADPHVRRKVVETIEHILAAD
nr:helix-turn-helix transcriptional regulator [uncultured Rhodopila sp.]